MSGLLNDTPAIELRHVVKKLGGRAVLRNVSLSVRRGEFFAILGPSGSGKSTLLKMVSGIDAPDCGEIWIGGRCVNPLPPYRRPVHTVFQNYALFPHLDVAANVAFPLRMAGVARADRPERVRKALAQVELQDYAERRVDQLSGGERQRVALARALVNEPECVLLDEPLSALDPHLRGQTMALLQDIQSRTGITYLYVTHDRDEALRAAHRVAVMRDGLVVQVGTPREVYGRPATSFVAGFVGPISWLDGDACPSEGIIRLDAGPRVPCGGEQQAGRVRIGVRPEDLRLGGDGFSEAQIVRRHFSGASVLLDLKVASGATLTAEVHSAADASEIGARVRIGWAPSAMHVFPTGEQAP